MPKDKDLKRLVRLRMSETGERYTEARSIIDERARSGPAPTDERSLSMAGLIAALVDPLTMPSAYEELKALPADILRPLAVAGMTHGEWRVRRACCRLLDDLAFTPDSLAALERCAGDSEPRVRRAAVHSLSCQHCKPEGCVVDVRATMEKAANDPSKLVRKLAVGALTWSTEEPWAVAILESVASSDPSAELRSLARSGLERVAATVASDAERRQLPEPLRSKTERHPGKWVVVSEGRIVDVGGARHAMDRRARRLGRENVAIYWVNRRPLAP